MTIKTLLTAFGPIKYEVCPRTVSRDAWEAALKTAHQAAWAKGIDDFVYTREMALADEVA